VQDANAGIAALIGGDATTDLSRILRVPETFNRKDARNGRAPTRCVLVDLPGHRYPFADLARFAVTSPARLKREKIAQVPLPRPHKMTSKRQDRLDQAISACVAAETGHRSEADFTLCCLAVEQGYDCEATWLTVAGVGKFAADGRRYFDRTWTAAQLHTRERLFEKASKHQRQKEEKREKAAEKPTEQAGDPDAIEAPDDPHRLARINLEHYTSRTGRTLAYWRGGWYVWKRNAYRTILSDELRAKVCGAVKQEFDRIAAESRAAGRDEEVISQKVTGAVVTNVLDATASMTCISAEIDPNTWLPTRTRQPYISMANGILDIDAVLADRDEYLQPNTPQWFSQVSLTYAFEPKAPCPRWEAFLDHNLEQDPERIKVVQEWAGYLLCPTTEEQKFMLLEGEGGNGKSVFIAGLTAMLGQDNVSNVPLEMFGDRFQRTDTIGKLLNAAGDCGEMDKTAEGVLKSFTSGDRMFFDRKGLPGLNCTPTARLMIACNNRPRLSDHSDGIWRRMLAVPWRVEITPEKRIKGMDKIAWWEASGELPGIFWWALKGLARLRHQRGFTDCQAMREVLIEYKEEMNPARFFLQENIEENVSGCIRCSELYRLYRKWTEENGYHPLSERSLGKEVRRVFRKCE
jgi:P4 family phage/plasmid primase-like protien